MKRHIENETLASLVTGALDEKEIALSREHLKECESCNSRYRLYEAILRKAPVPEGVYPRERVRMRVFASYREIKEKDQARGRGLFRRLFPSLRVAYVVAASSAIALIVAIRFFTGTDGGAGLPAELSLSGITGEVTVNGRSAGEHDTFTKGSRIITGSDASLSLAYRNILTVRVADETTLSMENSLYRQETETSVLEFRIDKGIVISTSEYRRGELTLTYRTPFAAISPIGTEFLVRSDPASSTVMIAKGSVSVQSLATGETRTGRAGEKITVAKTIAASSMDDRDMEFFRSMKGGKETGTGSGEKPEGKETAPPGGKGNGYKDIPGKRPDSAMTDKKHDKDRERDEKREMRRDMREGMQDRKDMRDMREMRQNGRGRGGK